MATLIHIPDNVIEAIVAEIRAVGWTGDIRAQQVLCLAEETGEVVGAARRYLGLARRTGSLDAVRLELADVVIVSHVVADQFGIDLARAVEDKLQIIFGRPFREDREPGNG